MTNKLRIFVICSYALSSSLLVEKMQKLAHKKEIPIEAKFISPENLRDKIGECDVVLLSPQVRFSKAIFQKLLEPAGIPVIDIPMQVYGLVDAEKAIALAIEAAKGMNRKGER
ncbi:MAG TPA: PTS sugar transporter subunit IIB [Anaerolineae bacterium]|nr:PTS sugar transporter subunit IIB [Anaerolineae bacterium]